LLLVLLPKGERRKTGGSAAEGGQGSSSKGKKGGNKNRSGKRGETKTLPKLTKALGRGGRGRRRGRGRTPWGGGSIRKLNKVKKKKIGETPEQEGRGP